jgi:hypothetical protein
VGVRQYEDGLIFDKSAGKFVVFVNWQLFQDHFTVIIEDVKDFGGLDKKQCLIGVEFDGYYIPHCRDVWERSIEVFDLVHVLGFDLPRVPQRRKRSKVDFRVIHFSKFTKSHPKN